MVELVGLTKELADRRAIAIELEPELELEKN